MSCINPTLLDALISPLEQCRIHTSRKNDVITRWYESSMQYSAKGMFDPTNNFAALAGVAKRFQEVLQSRYLAGLWETDMIRGLFWRSRRVYSGPHSKTPLTKPLGVRRLCGRELNRAPSWSWLALVGPILTGPGKRYDRRHLDPSTFRCRPASSCGLRWSPDQWKPSVVRFPFPACRLKVLGGLLEVCRSRQPISALWRKPNWSYSLAKLAQHAVLLEAADHVGAESQPQTRVATGLFDLVDDTTQPVWTMCLTAQEGLLLRQNEDESFSRLRIFTIENPEVFANLSIERLLLV